MAISEVIAITNQKGGVGKTTTAWALGCGLALRGARVLFVDMDAQGNLTHSLRAAPGEADVDIMDVLLRGEDIRYAIVSTDNGDIVPSSTSLAGADITIPNDATQKEFVLKRALASVRDIYDCIIIDTPPTLGIATINSLTACTGVIIPATADIYSAQGIGQLFQTIQSVRRYSNPFIKIRGILVTKYSERTVIGREMSSVLGAIAEKIKTKIYRTPIRECVDIRTAQLDRTSIFSHAPSGHAAEDHAAFVDEFLEDWRKRDAQREERIDRTGSSIPFWRRCGKGRTRDGEQDGEARDKR